MLRVELDAEDLGRIRFAQEPAPVLENLLMLFELRQPSVQGRRSAPRPAPARTTGAAMLGPASCARCAGPAHQ